MKMDEQRRPLLPASTAGQLESLPLESEDIFIGPGQASQAHALPRVSRRVSRRTPHYSSPETT